MCGILGGINQEIDFSLLDMIKHRGPDRQDIYKDIRSAYSIWLGHARLSIVDLTEAGNQPMISECGNYVLSYNGEIYNHRDLRDRMQFNNFKGHSDSETLLYYLIEKGEKGINDLNGIYAFAFYDRKNETLLLVRDRFGIKPLYYSAINDKFIFSSEIRPIQKITGSDMFLDGLSVLLQLRYIPSPYTLYKDIMKLRPGHYIKIDLKAGTPKLDFFQYDIPEVNTINIPFTDAVNLYEEYFNKAIERQLMSDVDIGVFLSGGVDSAMVACIANKYSPRKITSFTVGFDSGYSVNEIPAASATAKYLNIDHNYVRIDANNFFQVFEECSGIIEEPLATTSVIPMYYLSKLASKKVKVVLTGQGADEPLGGYTRYQGELIKLKYPDFIIKGFSKLVTMSGIKNEQLMRGANALVIDNELERFLSVYSVFTYREIGNLIGKKPELSEKLLEYVYHTLNCQKQKDSVSRMMSIDMRMNLADDLLLYTDKITMHFSLECRVPMLDYKLIDFLNSLPLHYKMAIRRSKIIHKAYAERILPKSIITRPKLGFQSPTNIWFNDNTDKISEILLSANSPMLNYFNAKYINTIGNPPALPGDPNSLTFQGI